MIEGYTVLREIHSERFIQSPLIHEFQVSSVNKALFTEDVFYYLIKSLVFSEENKGYKNWYAIDVHII